MQIVGVDDDNSDKKLVEMIQDNANVAHILAVAPSASLAYTGVDDDESLRLIDDDDEVPAKARAAIIACATDPNKAVAVVANQHVFKQLPLATSHSPAATDQELNGDAQRALDMFLHVAIIMRQADRLVSASV